MSQPPLPTLAAATAAAVPTGRLRPDYPLADPLWADTGGVFLTGTQAHAAPA